VNEHDGKWQLLQNEALVNNRNQTAETLRKLGAKMEM
jgi:hypothetical protein